MLGHLTIYFVMQDVLTIIRPHLKSHERLEVILLYLCHDFLNSLFPGQSRHVLVHPQHSL